MLTNLSLLNIALIESLDLDFKSGFTVFTGETGAGKSILFDALDAALGGGSTSDIARLLRPGVEKGHIEATFDLNPVLQTWLKKNNLYFEDQELFIRRDCARKQDRVLSRYRVNGTTVNRKQILSLRPLLIDITGQGQKQEIAKPTQQLYWLDCFGGENLSNFLPMVKKKWTNWFYASSKLKKYLKEKERIQNQQEEDLLTLEELENVQLDDSLEDKKLIQEQDRLVNGVRLQEGLSILLSRLQDGSDEIPSVLDHFNSCISELKIISKLDNTLIPQYDAFLDLECSTRSLIQLLENYSSVLESDPINLEAIQNRLSTLNRLKRKYNMDLDQLILLRDELRSNFQGEELNEKLNDLISIESNARKERDDYNIKLTEMRKQAALLLEQKLMEYLRPLGMLNVRFKVDIINTTPNQTGVDSVQYLFSANPGQPLLPLSDVASGGEMSRFLLALKTILSTIDNNNTIIFDEIDVGVSGRISRAIADLLKCLSQTKQVFCITHNPLVAASADHHFSVKKSVSDGITFSKVSYLLGKHARQAELAELAGGDFDKARIYAASLLEHDAA